MTSERSFIVYGMAVHAAGAQVIDGAMRQTMDSIWTRCWRRSMRTRAWFSWRIRIIRQERYYDAAAIDKFLAKRPGHVVIVLDEAYYEFAADFAARRKVEYSRSLEYVRQGASVVVLRTFSKVHGLAGLRIGYGLGPAELLSYCTRMRSTFSVSSMAQAAAFAALDDRTHVAHTISNNSEQAQILGVALSEMGFRVVPTWANFLYCDLGREAGEVAEKLRGQGIGVRPLGGWGAPSCLRVSIGTAAQNRALLQALGKVLSATTQSD